MERSSVQICLSAIIGAGLISPAFSAAAADNAKTAIQASYDAHCAAMKAGDIGAVAKLLSVDYMSVDPTGKSQNRDVAIANVKAMFAQANFTSCATKITALDKAGDGYVVTAELALSGTTKDLKAAPIRVLSKEKDTWKLFGGNWVASARVVTENTVSINGNVVSHKGGSSQP